MYLFLQADYDELVAKITEAREAVRACGEELGRSTTQSAETWHDNFGYDEAMRQMDLASSRLRSLLELNHNATIVAPKSSYARVEVGSTVTIHDCGTGKARTFKIASYMVFADYGGLEAVSYRAPIAQLVLGAKVGEVRKSNIGGRPHEWRIDTIT